MTNAEFLRNFKGHLKIFMRNISKLRVLDNLKTNECPFRLPSFSGKWGSNYLGLRGGKIVAIWKADSLYKEVTEYFYKSKNKKLVADMIKTVKATRWRGR